MCVCVFVYMAYTHIREVLAVVIILFPLRFSQYKRTTKIARRYTAGLSNFSAINFKGGARVYRVNRRKSRTYICDSSKREISALKKKRKRCTRDIITREDCRNQKIRIEDICEKDIKKRRCRARGEFARFRDAISVIEVCTWYRERERGNVRKLLSGLVWNYTLDRRAAAAAAANTSCCSALSVFYQRPLRQKAKGG